MRVSRFFQVFLGVFLALALFCGGGALIFFLLVYRMWGEPPRPSFANDDPNYKEKVLAEAKAKKAEAEKAKQEKAKQEKAAKATATPKATPKPTPTLEPGAYEAKVTWPDGLSIRSEPSYESGLVGGVDYDTPVVVLEESADGVWQKVRVKATNETGWVKAGNVDKI